MQPISTKQQNNEQQLPIGSLSISQSQIQMQQKQQYLRVEILQKNFNADDFIEYMNDKLNIDSDINKCSLPQLKKVVQSYIAKVKKDQIHMSEFDQNQPYRNSMYSVQSLPPTVMVKISTQPFIEQEEFKEIVKCCKIEQKYNSNQWKSKKVHCIVHSPNRKFITSFLGVNTSSYLQFKIKTFGLGWQVGRRYSDFIWLRNTLIKFYPTQMIPPIPNKKAHKRLARQLEKRMKILTFFLNDLLSYPQFINSRYLQGFLSLQESKFSTFKKDIDNKKCFQTITTTETLSGEVEISLNKQVLAYNKQLSKWIGESQIMLKDLTRNSKTLQGSIIEQVNTLYGMGDQLAGLHSGALKISRLQNRQDSGVFRLKDIFVRLNNMVVEWGSVLKNQIEFIETNCNIVYKYVRESLAGVREVIEKTKEHQFKYIQAKLLLDAQKEKLFALHDVQKWEIPKAQLSYIPKSAIYEKKQAFKIMLPKQSAVLEKLKMTYSYYLTRVYDNTNTFLKMKATLLCSAMEEFTIRQKVNNQQVGEMWNEMSFNFTHAFQEGKNKKKLWLKTQEKIQNQDTEMENYENSSMESTMNGRKD